MADIKWPFWQGRKKLLIDMGDGTHAECVSVAGSALGVGDLTTDAWGVQKVSLPVSLFHGLWTFDVPASMWFMYHNGAQVYSSSNITSASGAGRLGTSATNADLVLESRECPRYQPNRGHLFSTALICPYPTADGLREWGLQTNDNGVFFRLKSDGNLYAVLKTLGVETSEALISTNGDYDWAKGNLYDIQYQWRGVGNYKFFVNLNLVYEMNNVGMLTALSMANPALPIAFHAHRMTEDVELIIGCADVTSENGENHNMEQYASAYASNVAVVTNTPVIVVKSPLTIGSAVNTRTLTLARITVTCDKKSVFKVWKSRDATAFAGPTFKRVSTESFTESDSPDMDATAVRATAVDLDKLSLVTAIPVQALASREVANPYRDRIEFPIVRGDYLAVTCTSNGAGTAEAVVEWGEQI